MIIKKFGVEYPYFNVVTLTDTLLLQESESKLEEARRINSTPIKLWIDAQQNTFEIKMYRTIDSEDIIYVWHKINLQELTIKPGFVDQTAWIANEQVFNSNFKELKEYDIFDVFSKTIISKSKTFFNFYTPYIIFVPDSSDSRGFLSFNYRITMDSSTQYIVEGPSASSFIDEHIKLADFISPITLSSNQTTISADGSIIVNVQTDTFIDEVYLEQVYGILNKTRVKLTNGLGSFILYATGLEVGELVRVKAGHRKFTGIANFTAPVV